MKKTIPFILLFILSISLVSAATTIGENPFASEETLIDQFFNLFAAATPGQAEFGDRILVNADGVASSTCNSADLMARIFDSQNNLIDTLYALDYKVTVISGDYLSRNFYYTLPDSGNGGEWEIESYIYCDGSGIISPVNSFSFAVGSAAGTCDNPGENIGSPVCDTYEDVVIQYYYDNLCIRSYKIVEDCAAQGEECSGGTCIAPVTTSTTTTTLSATTAPQLIQDFQDISVNVGVTEWGFPMSQYFSGDNIVYSLEGGDFGLSQEDDVVIVTSTTPQLETVRFKATNSKGTTYSNYFILEFSDGQLPDLGPIIIDENTWGIGDLTYPRKDYYPIKSAISTIDSGTFSDLIDTVDDEEMPICFVEYGKYQCKDGGKCLAAKNSDSSLYEDNLALYEEFESKTTYSSSWWGNLILEFGESLEQAIGLEDSEEEFLENWGVCVPAEKLSLIEQFMDLTGIEDENTAWIVLGVVTLFLLILLSRLLK